MPAFSWDTVPLYMHVRKATGFTPEELKYLASFPLITFEKTTGARSSGDTEKGTIAAAKAVKQINPEATVLFYWNVLIKYPGYSANTALDAIPRSILVGQKGNTKLVRGTLPAYDLSNPAVRTWWLNEAKAACDSPYIDGVFVDAVRKVLDTSYLRRHVGAEKQLAVQSGYRTLMTRLPEALGSDKLVLANLLGARLPEAGLKEMHYFDGSYIEGLEAPVAGKTREQILAEGIQGMQAAARSGKIIALTMGADKPQNSGPELDDDDLVVSANGLDQKQFTYKLAIFLVCAEKYSYFLVHNGYGVDRGTSTWMKPLPEYSKPLGPPKGPAAKKGFTYTREFQHASVFLDIHSETARIDWK